MGVRGVCFFYVGNADEIRFRRSFRNGQQRRLTSEIRREKNKMYRIVRGKTASRMF